ncbi:MAG: alginate lyase family protein, partial [Ignavibacteria bacterium]|nr:alginate lyase family protein [Ignavibacteria bacterium]
MKNSILTILFISFCILDQQVIAQLNVFAIDGTVLLNNKNKISENDASLIPAYNQLIKDAASALKYGPVSVMEKTSVPPSGDKHDYMSLAPYYWPDPTKPDGLPYIRKDGETNPEVKLYKDKEYLPKLCESIYTLSLAYYFSNDAKYADHANTLLRVWFLDTTTKMNPNLNFGQAMKGHNDGRGAGLIDTRHLIKVVDAIEILNGTGQIKKENFIGLQSWFAQFLNWMQTSKNGIDEMNAKNNHGVWYDAQRLSFALFTSQSEKAKNIINNVQKRIDTQMNSDGFFPAELSRTTSLHYSLFVVEPLLLITQMGNKIKTDLLSYTSSNGNSIKKAVNAII